VYDSSLLARAACIKHKLSLFAQDPENSVMIDLVPSSELRRLNATPFFPADMLLMLSEVGSMRDRGMRDCALAD